MQQLDRTDGAHLERAGQPQQVVPVAGDQLAVDAVSGQAIQYAIVGASIQAPQPGVAQLGQAGAKAIPEEPKRAKHLVGVRPTVGDDFDGWRPGPLFEQTRQQIGRILGRAWYDDSTLPRERVIGEVEERRPMGATEVLRVVRGIQRAHRHDESEAVGRRHVATAPRLSEADQPLSCN